MHGKVVVITGATSGIGEVAAQRIADMGGTAPGGSAAEFAKFLADDTRRWAEAAAFAGVKAD